jgi:hypothetical protein
MGVSVVGVAAEDTIGMVVVEEGAAGRIIRWTVWPPFVV